jgi:DNA-binding transcriptional LysR family regulator
LVDDAFAAAALTPRTLYEVPADFTVPAALIRNALGTAFMPVSELARFEDLVGIPLVTPIDWQIYLARPERTDISPAAARLADMLVAAAEEARL